MRLNLWLLALGSSIVALTVQAQKDLAGCKTALDATLKTTATPHHAYSTETQQGKNRVSEAIAVNGKNYVQYQGKWRSSPMSIAETLQQEKENIDSAKVYTCRAIRDEASGGQAATVYHVHTESDVGKYDGDVWVAKSTGLVMHVEEDVDTGDATSKMHVSIKYDYSNVKAPPGV